ncbi:MAG TPA: hypothetical protein PLG08_00670 [Chitinophagaceae bacterium]|nr:hypothetical protein [Chitinophagaceae bacterium]
MKETASRAEFPAIAGMVICVLMAIVGFVFSFYMSQQLFGLDAGFNNFDKSGTPDGFGITMGITCLLLALIIFPPACLHCGLQIIPKMQ